METMSNGDLALEEVLTGIPGAELVLEGLRELKRGRPGECGLLVLIASPRLRRLGIKLPEWTEGSFPYEHQLYSLLETAHGDGAYSRYNSLLRRIVSFSHAL